MVDGLNVHLACIGTMSLVAAVIKLIRTVMPYPVIIIVTAHYEEALPSNFYQTHHRWEKWSRTAANKEQFLPEE